MPTTARFTARSCPPAATSTLSTDISVAVDNISSWMRWNRLQLNADKTEVMWCAVPSRSPVHPSNQSVMSVTWASLSTATLAPPPICSKNRVTLLRSSTAASPTASVRHQRLFLFSGGVAGASRLDYSSFILVGVPAYLQRRLQAVLNAAARSVFRLRRYEYVTDDLAILLWLRLPERINFKLALIAYQVLHGMAPE